MWLDAIKPPPKKLLIAAWCNLFLNYSSVTPMSSQVCAPYPKPPATPRRPPLLKSLLLLGSGCDWLGWIMTLSLVIIKKERKLIKISWRLISLQGWGRNCGGWDRHNALLNCSSIRLEKAIKKSYMDRAGQLKENSGLPFSYRNLIL